MKSLFPGSYGLSEAEFEVLWKNCLFVFDTNTLLHLYRYKEPARNELLGLLRALSDRIWIPFQVALEYQENRLGVIAKQFAQYDEVIKEVNSVLPSLRGKLEQLQVEKLHSSINTDTFLSQMQTIVQSFIGEVEEKRKSHPQVYEQDILRDEIDSLFNGRIGAPPKSQEDLDKLYQEAKKRYERQQPPGFNDESKALPRIYNNMVFERKYGDFLVWNAILEKCNTNKIEYLIFVTEDKKPDWWWIVESKGSKTIGPRRELIEEIRLKTPVKIFYMYTTENFMQYAKKYTNVIISQESIDEVRNISDDYEIKDDIGFDNLKLFPKEYINNIIVNWLFDTLYKTKGVSIHVNNKGLYDIGVVDGEGGTDIYEIKQVYDNDTNEIISIINNSIKNLYNINGYNRRTLIIISGRNSLFKYINIASKMEMINNINIIFGYIANEYIGIPKFFSAGALP